MKQYTFIHIFWHADTKFNPRMVQIICDPNNGFLPEEHLFVSPFRNVYDKIALIPGANVEFADVENPLSADVVNNYGARCDWLIVHSMSQPHFSLFIKKEYRKKIIWRTWGHDIGYDCSGKKWYSRQLKQLLNFFWKLEVREFAGVGISNVVDQLNIRKHFGEVPMYRLNYLSHDDYQDMRRALERYVSRTDGKTKIMIGHSGYPSDNHISILESLRVYENENIELYLVLSYGDRGYIDSVKQYIAEKWPEKAVIIDQFMAYEDFLVFLLDMDIAIFDGTKSYALANIRMLLDYHKKIFLNRNGILSEAFTAENVPYFCTDQIGKISFETFRTCVEYGNQIDSSLMTRSYEEDVNEWRVLFDSLKNR